MTAQRFSSALKLEPDPAREQNHDELVEAHALPLSLGHEVGVEAGGHSDEDFAARVHGADSSAYAIDSASSTCDTASMSTKQTIKPFALDFGWGLGSWQDLTDDGYQRLVRQYRRMVEDHDLGESIGMPIAVCKSRLARVEQVIETREALAESWLAEDFGSKSTADFERDTPDAKLRFRTEKGPSYGLACLFDYERHLRGESTVLQWSKA